MEKGSETAPHQCPYCGGAAYVGAYDLQCTTITCDHYHAETAAAYGRERFPSASDLLDDDPTEPTKRGGLQVVLTSDIHFPTLKTRVLDYVDQMRRQQEAETMDYFAALAGAPTDIAFGVQLDKWARIWGRDRLPGETDAELRKRIQGASMFSPGASL